MDEDIILKIKEKEAFEIIKYIAILYLIFLFIYALILEYSETIIETTFILVFVAVIDSLNSGELIVNEKGIKSKSIGYIKYNQISKLKFSKRNLIIYTKDSEKPLRIIFSINEDYKLIQKAYNFMDSKLTRIEEDEKEHKEYVKKYLQ